ncbi:MAG: hypothetical protein IJB65_05670 [Clostridia bacterium]|nr:hypothetical protein [Clostridia bacterium]
MTVLITLLNEIVTDIDFHGAIEDSDEENVRIKADAYFKRFKEVYESIGRHRYSDVSKYIDTLQQDAVDSLREGLDEIIRVAKDNQYCDDQEDPTNNVCFMKVAKLYDHVELESIRYTSIKKIQCVADANSKHEEEVIKLFDDAEKAVSEAHEQAKHLSQQLISILGIFAGIIVTFSFATATVGETIANLAKNDVVYLGFVIAVLGTVFINVLAILFSFVAKLSGHKLSKPFPWVVYIVGNLVTVVMAIALFSKMS